MEGHRHNILFLAPVPHIGGAEMSLLALLKRLDRRLFLPFCMVPDRGPLYDRIRDLGVAVDAMPLRRLKLPALAGYLRAVLGLHRVIRKNRIHLVVCTIEICNQYGLPAARLAGVPIACHARNLLPDARSFRRTLLQFPDLLIANSRATAQSYRHLLRNGQRSLVIHNGVDLREFSPGPGTRSFREEHGIGRDKYLIAAVARISREKRQDVLLEAAARLARSHPDIFVAIVGDTRIDRSDGYLSELKAQVKRLGLADRVGFFGFVSDIRGLYSELDLLALPSAAEPFGRVLIEAMAMEVPVVATRAGGAIEIVAHGVTGLLVEPGDPGSLAGAIARMRAHRAAASRMGRAGRKRAAARFSIEKNVERTHTAYLSALGERETS